VIQSEGFLVDEVRNKLINPHHETLIKPDEKLIVLSMRERQVTELEKLFQVSVWFL